MNVLRRWYVSGSLFSRLAIIVGLGLLLAGSISLWISLPIVNSLASLVADTNQLSGFGAARLRLVELYKLRHQTIEERVRACDKAQLPKACPLRWGEKEFLWERGAKPVPSGDEFVWLNDATLVWNHPTGQWMAAFPWEPVQPIVQDISSWLATREHIGLVGEEMTKSFVLTMVGTTVVSVLICSGLLLFFTRHLRVRYQFMSNYIRALGKGELVPRPKELDGDDDMSHLAHQIETLSADLAAERQRAIEADRMATWQTMARKVAHEIKNPLMPISLVGEQIGRVALKVSDASLASMLGESSRVISEEIHSLDRMVREFTGFARLPKPERQSLDLCAVVADFVRRNETADGPRYTLQVRHPQMMAMIDKGMIHQVLHNLVTNAKLAKLPARVTIAISLGEHQGLWSIDVQDDGPGISEEIRDRMFDAYVTTRSTGDGAKGMGLGLTISRQIARDHGGSLTLKSTGPTGTTMRLLIPKEKDNHDAVKS